MMSDIGKIIVSHESSDPETVDRLSELSDWSDEVARDTAKKEGLEMNADRWEVVRYLRAYYLQHGKIDSARKWTEVLDRKFAARGGRKYLYTLFPKGPVAQGSRIAGLPVPPDAENISFGSVH